MGTTIISISNNAVIPNPIYENCQVIPESVPRTEHIHNHPYEISQGVPENECIRQLP